VLDLTTGYDMINIEKLLRKTFNWSNFLIRQLIFGGKVSLSLPNPKKKERMACSRKLTVTFICDDTGRWTLLDSKLQHWNRDKLEWNVVKEDDNICVYIDDLTHRKLPRMSGKRRRIDLPRLTPVWPKSDNSSTE